MPNPDLDEFLTSTCTRRRYTEGWSGGQSTLTHEDLAGITCGIRALSDRLRMKGYGTVKEATRLATFQPEADVLEPVVESVGSPATWDLLIMTAGPTAGEMYRVEAVHRRQVDTWATRKAECSLVRELPISTEAP